MRPCDCGNPAPHTHFSARSVNDPVCQVCGQEYRDHGERLICRILPLGWCQSVISFSDGSKQCDLPFDHPGDHRYVKIGPWAEKKEAETINHPSHYGGDTTYEAIKVIEAWKLGFCLGNAVKYICRADTKGMKLEDLKKAVWYISREISRLENENNKPIG